MFQSDLEAIEYNVVKKTEKEHVDHDLTVGWNYNSLTGFQITAVIAESVRSYSQETFP